MADRERVNSASNANSQKSGRNASRVERTCSSLLSSPSHSAPGARNQLSEQRVSPAVRRAGAGSSKYRDKMIPVRNKADGSVASQSGKVGDTKMQPPVSVLAQSTSVEVVTSSGTALAVAGCSSKLNPPIVVQATGHPVSTSKAETDPGSESAASLSASCVTSQISSIAEGVVHSSVKEDSSLDDSFSNDGDSEYRTPLASRKLTPLALSHVLWPGFSDPISPSLKNSTSLEFYEPAVSTVQKNFSSQAVHTPQSCSGAVPDASALHMQNWQASKSNVKERLVYVLENELLCDVYFIVGRGEENRRRFAAHKLILSIGSPVFDAMFNRHPHMGSDAKLNEKSSWCDDCANSESKPNTKSDENTSGKVLHSNQATDKGLSIVLTGCSNEIELPDVEPAAFNSLLRFFYTDEVILDADTVMSCLYVSKKYSVPAMEQACVDFLRQHLCGDNAVMLLAQARLFDEPQLAATCLEMIDRSTAEAVAADGFTEIDKQTLCAILERDTLGIRESRLYASVCRWAEAECSRQRREATVDNQRSVLVDVLPFIRFPLMTIEEFASGPAQSGLLNDREVVELFLYFTLNNSTAAGGGAAEIKTAGTGTAGMGSGTRTGSETVGTGSDTRGMAVRQRQLHYSTVPRCCLTGKEQVISRFCHVENRWGYSGTTDRIRFTVNRSIFVVGFGLYGSVSSPAEYRVNMQIIHSEGGHVCGSNDTTFVCDGSPNTSRVFFKEPIEIHANTSYTACAMLKGPDSFYGTTGLRKVTHDSLECGRVTFQFAYAAGINNGTSVEDGQLPEIIFYT